jgi:hypothetical protein
MRFNWTSIAAEDVEKLAKEHRLKPFEVQILDLRRKGMLVAFVAQEIGYSVRQTINHSNRIAEIISTTTNCDLCGIETQKDCTS